MNIYALKGFKVRFTGEGGYDGNRELARKRLEIGKIYTVICTVVFRYYTVVCLEGEEIPWDSVFFEDVEPQSEEDDKKNYWYRYYNRLLSHQEEYDEWFENSEGVLYKNKLG